MALGYGRRMWLWTMMAWASDDAVLARIRDAAPVAEALVVDGLDLDWAQLPQMRVPDGDVRRVALAPTTTTLFVLTELAPDVRDGRPIYFGVDASGGAGVEAVARVVGDEVAISPVRRDQPRDWRVSLRARVRRSGALVELSVPLDELRNLDEAEHAYVRVRVTLAAAEGDDSPALAAASYRLVPVPGPLDPPPERPEVARVEARLPLRGTWYVNQGALHGATHQDKWAWDLSIRDAALRARLGPDPEQALAFGEPLYSPGRGRVRSATDVHPDKDLDTRGAVSEANRVVIDLDDRTRVSMAHLQQGSVPVAVDQRVHAGQIVGRVGNSGKSSGPHLHLTYAGRDGEAAPVRLRDVIVRLNPSPDDPWQREVEGWEPQPGYFVEQRWPEP
jgi:hypothetical protein